MKKMFTIDRIWLTDERLSQFQFIEIFFHKGQAIENI